MDVVLNVPVRRFVVKYIRAKFELGPGQPWRITTRGKECITFYHMLERAPDRYEKYRRNEEVLQVMVPTWAHLKKGVFISQESVDHFITYVQSLLVDEITMYYFGVKNGIGLKRSDKVVTMIHRARENQPERTRRVLTKEGTRFFAQEATIYDILNKYNISENDLTFDSVVKQLQRSTACQKFA